MLHTRTLAPGHVVTYTAPDAVTARHTLEGVPTDDHSTLYRAVCSCQWSITTDIAVRRRNAVTHHARTAPLAAGTVVTYHGSITSEHGNEYVITRLAGERYNLADRDYPWFTLHNVRRASITPTGDVADVCACGHPREHATRYAPDACGECGCTQHDTA